MKQLKEIILGTSIMTIPIVLSIACGIIFNFLNWQLTNKIISSIINITKQVKQKEKNNYEV